MQAAKTTLISILSLSLLSSYLSAQDANYWTNQYGSRANLLGGAVVGSVVDLSGTFYNPGALPLLKEVDLILAAKVLQYPSISLDDLGQQEIKLNSSRLAPAPSMLAGLIRFKWLGKSILGYSVFDRNDIKIDLSGSKVTSVEDTPNFPGGVSIAADLGLFERLTEPWYGITWASKYKDKIGYGISTFAMFRGQKAQLNSTAEIVTNDNEVYLFNASRSYKFDNYRLLWKLGLTFDFIGLSYGLTITTPSIGVYSSGETGVNITYIGPDNDGDGKNDTFVATDFQKDLGSTYKTPLSIAAGTTLKLLRVKIYLSGEWFNSIGKYTVINPQDFIAQTSSDTLSSKITTESQAILNLAIGMEYNFSKNIAAVASFSTDFSTRPADTETNLSLASWDIYNILAGSTFKIGKSEFTLGLGYSYGEDTLNLQNSPASGNVIQQLQSDSSEVNFSYRNWKLVFGFTL
jgi:hypothetical protein